MAKLTWTQDRKYLDALPHLFFAPVNHVEPVFQDPDPGEKFEANLDKPWCRTEIAQQRQCTLQQNDYVVPFLILEHVEGFVENKISHGVKTKPKKEISGV